MNLRQNILCIMLEYSLALNSPEASIRVKTAIGSIQEELTKIAQSAGYGNIGVSSAFSQVQQSVTTPWIALFDIAEKQKVYREVYILLLFKADMSGLYLTINQGGGWTYSAPISIINFLEDIEAGYFGLSGQFPSLISSGFSSDRNIDLADSGIIARIHEKATVVYKYYERNQLLQENEIEDDIGTILDSYEAYVGNVLSKDIKLEKTNSEVTGVVIDSSPLKIPESFKEEFYAAKKMKTIGEYEAERIHAIVINSFQKLLEKNKIKTVNNRAIDLLSIDSAGKPIMLFEAKTDASTTSIYGAIGQLLYHSTNLTGKCKLVALFPNDIGADSIKTLQRLNIKVITYRFVNNLPHFDILDFKNL